MEQESGELGLQSRTRVLLGAGVPARIVGCVDVPEPALEMDQRI